MESGDLFESFSQFVRYNEKENYGEVWGKPKAVWKRKDSGQPQTMLEAEKIALKIKNSELFASGNVSVVQASSTLKAEEIVFFNQEKWIQAQGGSPQFKIQETQHHTEISATKIIAWTEKKQIEFKEKVRGKVQLLSHTP